MACVSFPALPTPLCHHTCLGMIHQPDDAIVADREGVTGHSGPRRQHDTMGVIEEGKHTMVVKEHEHHVLVFFWGGINKMSFFPGKDK